ncbi:hypothetical protein VZP55_34975 [Myxococcus faecalis]
MVTSATWLSGPRRSTLPLSSGPFARSNRRWDSSLVRRSTSASCASLASAEMSSTGMLSVSSGRTTCTGSPSSRAANTVRSDSCRRTTWFTHRSSSGMSSVPVNCTVMWTL